MKQIIRTVVNVECLGGCGAGDDVWMYCKQYCLKCYKVKAQRERRAKLKGLSAQPEVVVGLPPSAEI